MSSAGRSFAHAWLHVGPDFTIRCSTYPNQVPILSIDAGDSAISLTTAARDATDDALRFARSLAQGAQEFAAEIERMHAATLADDGSAASSGTKATNPKAA